MKVKEYIQEVLKGLDKELDIGVTFELEVDENLTVRTGGGQKIKFSCKRK